MIAGYYRTTIDGYTRTMINEYILASRGILDNNDSHIESIAQLCQPIGGS